MGLSGRRFAVWSNLFYLVPLAVAYALHLTWMTIALLFLVLFSTAFHLLRERDFIRSDMIAAIVVLALNVWLFVKGNTNDFTYVLVGLLAFGALVIRFGVERGNRSGAAHGIWHLLAATITVVCILSYASVFG